MAFGNAITEFTQLAIGAYGYIVAVNLTSLNMVTVEMVQAQTDAQTTLPPITSEISLSELLGYVADVDAPDLAFAYDEGSICYIFLKTTVYPYTSNTRISLTGLRNPQLMIADSDLIDFPVTYIPIVQQYMLELAYESVVGKVPYRIRFSIEQKEQEIEDGL